MTRFRSRKCKASGQAVVEFALILPVLMLVLMGVLEFGLVFMRQNALTNAAREGVRQAILPSTTENDVETLVDSLLSGAGIDPADVTVTVTNEGATGNPGDDVTVVVQYDHSILTGTILGLGTTINLSNTCVMRHE